jgi:hypothetical protein
MVLKWHHFLYTFHNNFHAGSFYTIARSEKNRMKNAHYAFLAITLASYILLYGIIALIS